MCAQPLSCVQLFVTPWTVARQAFLSTGFSWQEYWNRLPFLQISLIQAFFFFFSFSRIQSRFTPPHLDILSVVSPILGHYPTSLCCSWCWHLERIQVGCFEGQSTFWNCPMVSSLFDLGQSSPARIPHLVVCLPCLPRGDGVSDPAYSGCGLTSAGKGTVPVFVITKCGRASLGLEIVTHWVSIPWSLPDSVITTGITGLWFSNSTTSSTFIS